jgi:hypothetical protein
MYNNDSPANPIITDRNKSTYTNPEGQIYLTVGTGGAGLHKLNGNKAPYTVTAQDEEHGFLSVDVTANNAGTSLVGTFYSNNGGEMTDQFTITKSGAGDSSLLPPPLPPDLPIQQTDGIEEADAEDIIDIDLDDAVGAEDSEDVDATDDGDGGDDGDDGGDN